MKETYSILFRRYQLPAGLLRLANKIVGLFISVHVMIREWPAQSNLAAHLFDGTEEFFRVADTCICQQWMTVDGNR